MDRKYHLIADGEALAAAGRLRPLFTEEKLVSLSNKGTYKRALKDAEGLSEVKISVEGKGVAVKTDESEVFLSENISEWKCGCPAKIICRHIITAAVLAAENGTETDTAAPPSEFVPAETEKLPEADMTYLSEVKSALEKILAKGLMNCGASDIETLERLSLKSSGTVHRSLGKLCRSLSESITLMNSRSSSFSPLQASLLAGRIYNLASASEKFPKLLDAVNDYVGINSESFLCAGVYPWVTSSGYGGVTAVVFGINSKRRFGCTVTAPLIYAKKTEAETAENTRGLVSRRCLWKEELSPEKLSGRIFHLYGAMADANGRLSSSSKTSCVFSDWLTADKLPEELFVPPVPKYDYFKPDKTEKFFAVKVDCLILRKTPAASSFLEFTVITEEGKTCVCSLKYTAVNRKACDFINRSKGEALNGKLLLLRKAGSTLTPVSVISEEGVYNIFF